MSRHAYEESIRAYYAARSDDERAEDDAWAELSAGELSVVSQADEGAQK